MNISDRSESAVTITFPGHMQSFAIDKKYIRCVLIDQVGVYARDCVKPFVFYLYNDPDNFDVRVDGAQDITSYVRCIHSWVYIHID
jgi:hypothetical protein